MYFRLLSRKPISSCPISKKLPPLRTGGPFSTKLHPCSGGFADRGSVRSALSSTGEPAKKKGEQICVDVIFDGHLSSFSFYLFVLLLPRRRGRIEWAGGLLHSLRGWIGEVKGGGLKCGRRHNWGMGGHAAGEEGMRMEISWEGEEREEGEGNKHEGILRRKSSPSLHSRLFLFVGFPLSLLSLCRLFFSGVSLARVGRVRALFGSCCSLKTVCFVS